MYIQITDAGWKHLQNTVGESFIKHCILSHEESIDGETWYKLQTHEVFSLFHVPLSTALMFKTTVMFDDNTLTDNI